MIAFWIGFAVVTIIALAVTIHNIADGLSKAKKELDRGVGLDNSEYDYGHNVEHTYEEALSEGVREAIKILKEE